MRRRDRAVADEADALSRTAVQDLVAIDRHGDRLHVALLVEDVARRLVRDHAVERERSDLLVVQRRVRLHRGDILAVDQVDELNVPGAEVREAHVSVRDDLDGHLIEVWELVPVRILAPPVGVLLERVVVVLDGLGEDERSGSSLERLEGEVGADCLDDLSRDHHPRAVDERPEERRERRLEVELHGLRIDDGHGVHGRKVARSERPLRRLVPLERAGMRGASGLGQEGPDLRG